MLYEHFQLPMQHERMESGCGGGRCRACGRLGAALPLTANCDGGWDWDWARRHKNAYIIHVTLPTPPPPRLPFSVRHANKHINNILRKTWQSGAAHAPAPTFSISLYLSLQNVAEHKMQLINHSGKSSFAAWFIFVAFPSGCQPQQKLKFFICRQAGRRRRQCDPRPSPAQFSTYWQRWRRNWPKYCSIKKQSNEANEEKWKKNHSESKWRL